MQPPLTWVKAEETSVCVCIYIHTRTHTHAQKPFLSHLEVKYIGFNLFRLETYRDPNYNHYLTNPKYNTQTSLHSQPQYPVCLRN